jgi:hypothetical protein
VLDHKFIESIRSIEWFASCGDDLQSELPIEIYRVMSWAEAKRLNDDENWHDAMLEAQNILTVHLHSNNRERYRAWNEIATEAKRVCVMPLTKEVWMPFAATRGMSPALEQSTQWNVLGAIMEHEYRDIPGCPDFFTHLLSLFRAGHLPCGWVGEFPTGKLCVL